MPEYVSLKSLLSDTRDGDWGKQEPFEESELYAIIRGADFKKVEIGEVEDVPRLYMSASTVSRRTLQKNDIVLETAGGTQDRPTGRTTFITEKLLQKFDTPVTCASFTRFLRPDPERVLPEFLFWKLRAMYVQGLTHPFHLQHTGVGRFQYTDFSQRDLIDLPSEYLQSAISEILRAIQNKIEANNKLAHTADELASALYLAATKYSFQEVPLSALADFVNGKAFTKNATGAGRVVIRIAEMNNGIGPSTVFNDLVVDEQHIARPGDILFAWSGSLNVMRWQLEEGIINQHIFKVLAKPGTPDWLVFTAIQEKLNYFKAIAADKATTMGHIQRKHLDELVRVPTPTMLESLSQSIEPLWNRAFSARQENNNLVELRDYLLPRLMSGKITVKEAESLIN